GSAPALGRAAGTAGCMRIRRKLDALAVGDASAATTGVHVETLRVTAIVLACLLTGVAVAFGGVIAFVGLIVPHAIRLVVEIGRASCREREEGAGGAGDVRDGGEGRDDASGRAEP